MARKQTFHDAAFSDRYKESYPNSQSNEQKSIDRVVVALLKGEVTPGMRIKPIEPEKYYNEARINDGDRLVHRIEEGVVYFVDIVSHDLISKYGRKR